MLFYFLKQLDCALIRNMALFELDCVQIVAKCCGGGDEFSPIIKNQRITHIDDFLIIFYTIFEIIFDFGAEFRIENTLGKTTFSVRNTIVVIIFVILQVINTSIYFIVGHLGLVLFVVSKDKAVLCFLPGIREGLFFHKFGGRVVVDRRRSLRLMIGRLPDLLYNIWHQILILVHNVLQHARTRNIPGNTDEYFVLLAALLDLGWATGVATLVLFLFGGARAVLIGIVARRV